MLAHEVMTSPVVTVRPDAPVKEAIRLLDRHDITALPVLDEDERLVGVISEADLLRGGVADDPRAHVLPVDRWHEHAGTTVADVMTRRVVTARENTDASDIARIMLDTGVKSLPVVRGHTVVGIVSRRDLIRALATTDEQIRAEIESLLKEAGLSEWSAAVTDGEVELIGHGTERDTRVAEILVRTVAGVGDVRLPNDHER